LLCWTRRQRGATPRPHASNCAKTFARSFDLCDRQPSVEAVLQLLLQHYDHEASPPLSATRDVLAKLAELARSGKRFVSGADS
jgi:DTW domain-containing protein YfiP